MVLSHLTRTIRLAIVSRQGMFRDGLGTWLGNQYSAVEVAVTTAETAEVIAVGSSSEALVIDVVIVDADGMTIVEVDRAVADLASLHKVIVVASDPNSVLVRAAVDSGAVGFVSKSESALEVARAVRSSLLDREYYTPEVIGILDDEDIEDTRPALSDRERKVMDLYASGMPVKVVATELGLSQDTVRTYLKRVKAKYSGVGIPLHTKFDFYVHSRD